MDKQNYERWKEFAIKMADRGLGLRLSKSRDFVRECVVEFFEHLESDYIGLEYPYDGWLDRVMGWCNTDYHPTHRDLYGHRESGGLICDIANEFVDGFNTGGGYDEDSEYQRWDELWGSRIQCCLRAGMDVVCDDSGVIGFSAGDLKRMYPDGVPGWAGGGDKRWSEGPLHGPYELNGTLAEMADDAPILL